MSPSHTLARSVFFFNDTATTEIYTLSLHDALPISGDVVHHREEDLLHDRPQAAGAGAAQDGLVGDRKSTRLNSSHMSISYAVFCLKKKKARPACGRDRRHTSGGSAARTRRTMLARR